MQEQINTRPLVDILSEQTQKIVVMSGEKYVYLDTKTEVEASEVEIAIVKRDEELLAQEITTKVLEAKQYLSDTDWVVTKISEANINGEDISDLLTQYADILTSRADARATINSLEQ